MEFKYDVIVIGAGHGKSGFKNLSYHHGHE